MESPGSGGGGRGHSGPDEPLSAKNPPLPGSPVDPKVLDFMKRLAPLATLLEAAWKMRDADRIFGVHVLSVFNHPLRGRPPEDPFEIPEGLLLQEWQIPAEVSSKLDVPARWRIPASAPEHARTADRAWVSAALEALEPLPVYLGQHLLDYLNALEDYVVRVSGLDPETTLAMLSGASHRQLGDEGMGWILLRLLKVSQQIYVANREAGSRHDVAWSRVAQRLVVRGPIPPGTSSTRQKVGKWLESWIEGALKNARRQTRIQQGNETLDELEAAERLLERAVSRTCPWPWISGSQRLPGPDEGAAAAMIGSLLILIGQKKKLRRVMPEPLVRAGFLEKEWSALHCARTGSLIFQAGIQDTTSLSLETTSTYMASARRLWAATLTNPPATHLMLQKPQSISRLCNTDSTQEWMGLDVSAIDAIRARLPEFLEWLKERLNAEIPKRS